MRILDRLRRRLASVVDPGPTVPDPVGRWYLVREAMPDLSHRGGHVVEAIEADRDSVLLVTMFSEPMRHWRIPRDMLEHAMANLIVEDLGRGEDLRWIRRGAWVVSIEELASGDVARTLGRGIDAAGEVMIRHERGGLGGFWRVADVLNGSIIRMYRRAAVVDGVRVVRPRECTFTNFHERYRRATPAEIHEAETLYGMSLPEPEPMEIRQAEPPEEEEETPPVPPGLTLRDRRDEIMRTLAASLQGCIEAAPQRGNPEPRWFEALIDIRFAGTQEKVLVRSILDFTVPRGEPVKVQEDPRPLWDRLSEEV